MICRKKLSKIMNGSGRGGSKDKETETLPQKPFRIIIGHIIRREF